MKKSLLTLLAPFIFIFLSAQTAETIETDIQKATFQETPITMDQADLKDKPIAGLTDITPVLWLSKVYPNPASEVANFDFEWKKNMTDAKLVIYNLLGSVVRESEIVEKSGTIKINTSDLLEGIYFYSLVIKNQPAMTQKLVIRR